MLLQIVPDFIRAGNPGLHTVVSPRVAWGRDIEVVCVVIRNPELFPYINTVDLITHLHQAVAAKM